MPDRSGKRKTREQFSKRRIPELGYYFIVTDTKETEQNYMYVNDFAIHYDARCACCFRGFLREQMGSNKKPFIGSSSRSSSGFSMMA